MELHREKRRIQDNRRGHWETRVRRESVSGALVSISHGYSSDDPTEGKSERRKVRVFRWRSLQWSHPFITILFLSIRDRRSFYNMRMHSPELADVLWSVRMRHGSHMHSGWYGLDRSILVDCQANQP